ncbi:MAG: hypothetical protein J6Y59_07000 [Bacteroidaceae bacterium]|nr:hypothetical protein [Bacteroidaceae bacterium]
MKKERIILALLALLFAGIAAAQEIAYIESDRNWHRLYDAKGKKIGGFARSSVGEVVGWGSTFFVGKNTGFYRIYDVKGRVTASQSISNVGEVLSVSAGTITSRKGNWILIWDDKFKKIGSRPAPSR